MGRRARRRQRRDLPGLTRLATAIKRHGAAAYRAAVPRRRARDAAPDRRAGVERERIPRGRRRTSSRRARRPRPTSRARSKRSPRPRRAARRPGFDGVELHGAHGYSADAVHLDASTNTRTDGVGRLARASRAARARGVARGPRARAARASASACGCRSSTAAARAGSISTRASRSRAGSPTTAPTSSTRRCGDAENFTRKRPDEHPIPLLRAAVPADVAMIACGQHLDVRRMRPRRASAAPTWSRSHGPRS